MMSCVITFKVSLMSEPLVSFGGEGSDLAAQCRGLGLRGPIAQ